MHSQSHYKQGLRAPGTKPKTESRSRDLGGISTATVHVLHAPVPPFQPRQSSLHPRGPSALQTSHNQEHLRLLKTSFRTQPPARPPKSLDGFGERVDGSGAPQTSKCTPDLSGGVNEVVDVLPGGTELPLILASLRFIAQDTSHNVCIGHVTSDTHKTRHHAGTCACVACLSLALDSLCLGGAVPPHAAAASAAAYNERCT